MRLYSNHNGLIWSEDGLCIAFVTMKYRNLKSMEKMTQGCFWVIWGRFNRFQKKNFEKFFFSVFSILSKIQFFRISTFFVIFFQAINYFRKFWLFSSRVGSTQYVRRKKLPRSDFTLAGEGPEVGPRAQNREFFSVKILL